MFHFWITDLYWWPLFWHIWPYHVFVLFRPKFSRIKDKKQLAEYIDKNDPSLELAKFSFSVKDALELAGGDPDDQVPDVKAEVKEEGAAPPAAAAEPLQATAST